MMMTRDPILSTSRPDIGEPSAVAMTSGSSMKLAAEGVTLNIFTAKLGRKRMDDWKKP